ncbi:MAG: hypothetical protein ABI680_17625 [Chthoniobacteraceae bacterium]
MDEELLKKAKAFADANGGSSGEELGSGIHGMVVVLKSEIGLAETALKIHFSVEPYRRECDVYERLRERGIRKILGFHVPQMLRSDDAPLAIEMTLVPPPFVLDFAGAWLDFPPEFPAEVWAERREKWASEFGGDWAQAQAILAELEELHIYMLDPFPNNIRFR